MKNKFLLLAILFCWQLTAHAADLIEVYQQALGSDPIYQQAIAQRLATREGVPISIADLLPNISGDILPSIDRQAFSGSFFAIDPNTGLPLSPRNNTLRAYTMTLTIKQTIFDYAKFSKYSGELANAKGADAALNAALQSLMTRVASAYFAILRDEDNLRYSEASKIAFAQQLDQVKQQFEVGLKTITDVYTAQASYDSAVAKYIAAQNTLDNDRENLRVITGKYYSYLSPLSEAFPLITPQPENIDEWVRIAECQNWSIKQFQYNVDNARYLVREQFAGHLPTVTAIGTLDRIYNLNINGYNTLTQRNGPGMQTDREFAVDINIPFFSGGGTTAKTNQATYNFQVAEQQLEQTVRNTINNTRQSYLGIISGISQIRADQQTVKSTISSLKGMEASYEVGTETLVNVLNQREKVYQAQTQYATDRYNFVNNILALKQAAGTLSIDDLCAINAWLGSDGGHQYTMNYYPRKKRHSVMHMSS